MVDASTLRVGGVYVGKGQRRVITKILGDVVTYRGEHSLSFMPLRASLKEFSEWATHVVEDESGK